MTKYFCIVALIMTAVTVQAEELPPAYQSLRDGATKLPSLGPFLDKYLGDCGDSKEFAADCERRTAAERTLANGKRMVTLVDDLPAGLVQVVEVNNASGEFTATVTPFFSASDGAITQGTPKSTDAKGNPVFAVIPVRGTIPDGWSPSMLKRQFESGGVRVEIIFTPEGVWKLPGKGSAQAQHGVRSRIDGMLFTAARNGTVLASWVRPQR